MFCLHFMFWISSSLKTLKESRSKYYKILAPNLCWCSLNKK